MLQITPELLTGLENLPLFYPHSGHDWQIVSKFASHLKEFHFADRDYFQKEIEKQTPLFGLASRFHLLKMDWEISPHLNEIYQSNNWIMGEREPLSRRETYSIDRKEIQFVLHRQNSLAVFDSLPKLGVFLYRGDSSEGGNVAWLTANPTSENQPAMLTAVLDKLVEGGLLVTDGSRVEDRPSQIEPIAHFAGQTISADFETSAIAPFEAFGRHFQCLGVLKHGRRPTLVWRVTK